MLKRICIVGSILAVLGIALFYLPSHAGEKAPPVISTLKGHTDVIYTVAYTKDGKYLITGSFDNTIKLWEIKTGKEVKTFGGPQGHKKMVLSVDVSPNGQVLASGSADNSLKLWDIPVPTPVKTFKGEGEMNAVALSPDNKRLAAAGKDGVIQVWNTEDDKKLYDFKGHEGAVTGLAFSGNGQTLASTGVDNTLRYWNVTNGESIATVGAHIGRVNGVEFHPNNNSTYTIGQDGYLRYWKALPEPPKAFPEHAGTIHSVLLVPNGSQVFTGGEDKIVRLSQLNNGQQVRQYEGVTGTVNSLATTTNVNLLAAGTSDGQLMIWNGGDGKLIDTSLAHDGEVTGVSIPPQNNQVLTGGDDGLIKVWSLPPVEAKLISNPAPIASSAVRRDGQLFFAGGADKILRTWDPEKKAMVRQYTGHEGPVTAVAVSPNNAILASGSEDATIRFWNQDDGKEIARVIGHEKTITSMAINGANNQMVSASQDGSLKVWQLPVTPAKSLAHADQVTCIAISPDGQRVATGGNDKRVSIWNLQNGNKERDLTGPSLPIACVDYSSNNQLIAAGSADKTVTVWNAGNGQTVKEFKLPQPVDSVAVSRDAKTVAAGLRDKTIRLLNLADGKEIGKLTGHQGPVTGLVYADNGELISASADKSIQFWEIKTEKVKVKDKKGKETVKEILVGKVKAKVQHSSPVTSLARSRDGKRFTAAGGKDVKLWSTDDRKELGSFTVAADIKGVGISPDGKRISVACEDNQVRLFEGDGTWVESFVHDGTANGVVMADEKRVISASADKTARIWASAVVWLKSLETPINRVAYLPNSQQIFAASDKAVHIWNASDGKDVKSPPAQPATVTNIDVNDGKLVTASADKKVNVWPVANATKPQNTITLKADAESIAISPDGKRLAVGVTVDKKPLIHVYDIEGKTQLLQVFPGHSDAVSSLHFLADNQTVVSSSPDKTARYNFVGVLRTFAAHPGGVTSVQFHSNGSQGITGGKDKTVKYWDLNSGKVIRTYATLPEPVTAVAYSRNYAYVGAAYGKTVKIWNAGNGQEIKTLEHPSKVLSLSFSPDNDKVVTGAEDKRTRVWQIESAKLLQFFPESDAVNAVYFNNQNNGVVSAAGKKSHHHNMSIIRVVDDGKEPLYSIARYTNGAYVLVGGEDEKVRLWNTGNGNNDRTYDAADPVKAVAMSKNNQMVAAGCQGKKLQVFNFGNAQVHKTIDTPGEVQTLEFSPNTQALIAGFDNKSMIAFSLAMEGNNPSKTDFLKPIQTFETKGAVTRVVTAEDNSTFYTASTDKTAHAWRLASPNPIRSINHSDHVDVVAFDPTGKIVATGDHDGNLRLIDVEKGNTIRSINAHKQDNATMIYTVEFSPDGKQVLTGGYDGSLKLWNVSNGSMVREFKAYKKKDFEQGHQDSVFTAAFSPDGKYIASGSAGLERVIKIWDVNSGKVVRDLQNPGIKTPPKAPPQSHPGWIYKLRFSKDGKYLISSGNAPKNQGYLAVWNPRDGKMLYGQSMPMGTFYGLALSPDETTIAVGTGPRNRYTERYTEAYVIPNPVK